MNKDKTTELLPCPFCGGVRISLVDAEAEVNTKNLRDVFVICDHCFGHTQLKSYGAHPYNDRTKLQCESESIKAWNTRATRPTAVNTELLEALKFYAKLENYMAELLPPSKSGLNRGFDFKHTPVHNDSGEIAKQAIAAYEAQQKPMSPDEYAAFYDRPPKLPEAQQVGRE